MFLSADYADCADLLCFRTACHLRLDFEWSEFRGISPVELALSKAERGKMTKQSSHIISNRFLAAIVEQRPLKIVIWGVAFRKVPENELINLVVFKCIKQ